jgi:hypothetical protein
LTFFEETIENIRNGTVDPRNFALLVSDCENDKAIDKHLGGRKGVYNAVRSMSDDDLFYFINLSSLRIFYNIVSSGDNEFKRRIVQSCVERRFSSKSIVKIMNGLYPAEYISRFCIETGRPNHIRYISYDGIMKIPTEHLESFFSDLRKIPGYQKIKAFMLNRDDLNKEQRLYALKSAINCGFRTVNLSKKRIYITLDELNALPYGMLRKLIDYYILARWSNVELDQSITYDDVAKALFVLLINNQPVYSRIMDKLEKKMAG